MVWNGNFGMEDARKKWNGRFQEWNGRQSSILDFANGIHRKVYTDIENHVLTSYLSSAINSR